MQNQKRNLNPHAEAIAAMFLYGKDYAAQNGGSMEKIKKARAPDG